MRGRGLIPPALLLVGVLVMWWAQTSGWNPAELGDGSEGTGADETGDTDRGGGEQDSEVPGEPAGAPDEPERERPPTQAEDPLVETLEDIILVSSLPGHETDGPPTAAPGDLMDPASAADLPPGMVYPREDRGVIELWVWSGPENLTGIDLWADWDPKWSPMRYAHLRYAAMGTARARVVTDPESGRRRLWLSHGLPAELETKGTFLHVGTLAFKMSPNPSCWLRFEPRSVADEEHHSEADRMRVYRGIQIWPER